MFGLRQEIGGDPVGIVVGIGHDQHFGRTGDHVDADGAEDLALGGGHPGIAGANNLGDGTNGFGAVGECSNGLSAADPVDLADTGDAGRGEHRRVERAVASRHHHDDALDARHPGRHGVHQNRTRVARGAAGHIKADGFDCCPARPQLDTQCVNIVIILGHLPLVMTGDAVMGQLKRSNDGRVCGLIGCRDLVRGYGKPKRPRINPVEALAECVQGLVATLAHIMDDRADIGLNVDRHLTLGGEECRKPAFEIRLPVIKPQYQCPAPISSVCPISRRADGAA